MSLDDAGAKQQSPAPSTKNEMAGLIASKDWSKTALGDTNNWSPSLKLIVGIMTASGFPMAVRWGPEFILIYNDGYRSILADKHPWALGLPFRVVWPEVVSELIPLQEAILAGESPGVYSEDRPLTIRHELGDGAFYRQLQPGTRSFITDWGRWRARHGRGNK